MIGNKKRPGGASDSKGPGPGDDQGRRWDALMQAGVDEHLQRALTRVEERMQRAIARVEAEERRARERLEQELQRAQATLDARNQGVRNGRERILIAAKALFLDKGYIPTSMQEIAEAAGLRKASIYHHFQDKEALFSEIVLEEITAWSDHLRSVIDENRSLSASLFELALVQMKMSQNDDGRLFMEFQKHVPEERHAQVHAMLQTWVNEFAVLFERAIERKEIGPIDPRVAALFFFHMGAAWTFHGMEDPTLLPSDPSTGAATIVDVLLNGLVGRPETKD